MSGHLMTLGALCTSQMSSRFSSVMGPFVVDWILWSPGHKRRLGKYKYLVAQDQISLQQTTCYSFDALFRQVFQKKVWFYLLLFFYYLVQKYPNEILSMQKILVFPWSFFCVHYIFFFLNGTWDKRALQIHSRYPCLRQKCGSPYV